MRLVPPFKLLVPLALIGAYAYSRTRRRMTENGSQTNASDAVDDIELSPDASPDEILDAGVAETFPASDPVSVSGAVETAYDKEQRRRRGQ
jgi:hypothetical protein